MFKKNLKDFFAPRSLIFFMAVALAFVLVWQASEAALENYALQQKVDELQSQVDLLELENQRIGYNIEYYKTDSYLDLAARENFNLKSPDEKVLYVPQYQSADNTSNQDAASKDSTDINGRSNFESWVDFLLGRNSS